jgi:hypothetical protein
MEGGMILWKNWGILELPIVLVAYLVGLVVTNVQGGLGFFVTMAVAAVLNWILGRWINRSRSQANAAILKTPNPPWKSKAEWYLRYDRRASFFLIPMEWWSVIMLVVGIFGAFFPPAASSPA